VLVELVLDLLIFLGLSLDHLSQFVLVIYCIGSDNFDSFDKTVIVSHLSLIQIQMLQTYQNTNECLNNGRFIVQLLKLSIDNLIFLLQLNCYIQHIEIVQLCNLFLNHVISMLNFTVLLSHSQQICHITKHYKTTNFATLIFIEH